MKHERTFEFDLHRKKLDSSDRRGLSRESLEDMETWVGGFIFLVRDALLEAFEKGIVMPRRIRISGKIEISDE